MFVSTLMSDDFDYCLELDRDAKAASLRLKGPPNSYRLAVVRITRNEEGGETECSNCPEGSARAVSCANGGIIVHFSKELVMGALYVFSTFSLVVQKDDDCFTFHFEVTAGDDEPDEGDFEDS